MTEPARLVAGVDGCPAGWVAVIGPTADRDCRPAGPVWLAVSRSLGDLIHAHHRVVRWAIDMPLGLASEGSRPSDSQARALLGPRRSSVFPAIPLPALEAGDYGRACRLAEAATGKRISKQAWNLTPKVRELRSIVLASTRLRREAFEAHPELSFRAMNDGQPCAYAKKTDEGHDERVTILAQRFGQATVERFVAQAAATRGLGVDDALDAAACWFTAARHLAGVSEAVGSDPESNRCSVDATGLSLAIHH